MTAANAAPMNILLLGNIGQLGYELVRTLAPLGNVSSIDRPDLQLTDAGNIRTAIRTARPHLIVNATAYTAVDQAEKEPDLAYAINADALAIIGEEAKRIESAVIHYSTDYVFDGAKAGPYLETDTPNPLNVYGMSKLKGEQALAASGAACLVFRISWLYGLRGANFLLTILRLAREREELRIIADQIGAPTWCRMVAEATAAVVAQIRSDTWDFGRAREYSDIYHLSAAGQTSWAGFAEAILREYAGRPEAAEVKARRVMPITTAEYPLPARRPANSLLANEKVARVFGLRLPGWCDQLHMALS